MITKQDHTQKTHEKDFHYCNVITRDVLHTDHRGFAWSDHGGGLGTLSDKNRKAKVYIQKNAF